MEPKDSMGLVLEFHHTISEIYDYIDEIQEIDDDSLLHSALIKFYDKLLKVRKLLLLGGINEILDNDYDDLKPKLKIIDGISSDLFTKYNIVSQYENRIFQKQAHNDSIKLSSVIIFLALITLWINIFVTDVSYTFFNYEIRFDVYIIPIIIFLGFLYHKHSKKIYEYTGNNFDMGLHPNP